MSPKLNRVRLGTRGSRTDPAGDAVQFGKRKAVERRLKGRQWKLVNGQLVEREPEDDEPVEHHPHCAACRFVDECDGTCSGFVAR